MPLTTAFCAKSDCVTVKPILEDSLPVSTVQKRESVRGLGTLAPTLGYSTSRKMAPEATFAHVGDILRRKPKKLAHAQQVPMDIAAISASLTAANS